MPKTLTALSDFPPDEVSIVTRGANRKKRFPITKSQEKEMLLEEILKAVLETEIEDEAKAEEIIKAMKLSDKGVAAVKGAMRLLTGFKDELPPDILNKLSALVGYPAPKAKEPEQPNSGEKNPMKKEVKDEIAKALETRIEKAEQENAELKKQLVDERNERILKEHIQKCKDEFSHVPGKNAEEMGKMLLKAYQTGEEFGKELEKQWTEIEKAMKESALLRSSGTPGKSTSGAAIDKIQAAAGKIKKSESGSKDPESIAKALEENPDLYEEYLAENPAQTRRM